MLHLILQALDVPDESTREYQRYVLALTINLFGIVNLDYPEPREIPVMEPESSSRVKISRFKRCMSPSPDLRPECLNEACLLKFKSQKIWPKRSKDNTLRWVFKQNQLLLHKLEEAEALLETRNETDESDLIQCQSAAQKDTSENNAQVKSGNEEDLTRDQSIVELNQLP